MTKQLFDATRFTGFYFDPSNLVIIGLDTKDGPEHPLYDERIHYDLSEEMILDVMRHGVLKPVLVRKNGDRAEVTDGRQRVRCAREANKRLAVRKDELVRVPCMPKAAEDGEHFGMSISANLHHTPDGPLVLARKAQRYISMGHSLEETAERFCVSTATVKAWGKLLDLAKPVQQAVDAGKLPATAAVQLAALPREEQVTQLATLIASGPATVRATSNAVRKQRNPDAGAAPGKRLITKVLKLNTSNGAELNGDFVRGVLWTLGEMPAEKIKGLTELIRKAQA